MLSRTGIAVGVVVCALFTGCQNPKQQTHLIVPEDEIVIQEGEIFLAPNAGEVDYVEHMSSARQAYRQSLSALKEYYQSTGNITKQEWVRDELETFDQMIHYRYLSPGEWLPVKRHAMSVIDDADTLYKEAAKMQQEAGLLKTNPEKLRQAINTYNQLIQQYPDSDKIDDAAYHAGRIYEHFKNYELAAIYYQRAFQWNDMTPYPARFRAAQVMDHQLKMYKEALALYREVVQKESRYPENVEYAQKRIATLTTPVPEETPEVQEEMPMQDEPPVQEQEETPAHQEQAL